ncbi:MAG: HDOD domain-containing protein, partial [Gammaproteobacteria bacterium]|nr:HDOD domain-containing protein [Gammaproteobacteria bacterium]
CINNYHGNFLYQPDFVSTKCMTTNKSAALRLINKLQDSEVTLDDVNAIISQDVTLSYKLLRYLNSASLMMRRKVDTIHNAILWMGLNPIRNWATILLMSSINEKPSELITTSLIRARFCEELAKKRKQDNVQPFFLTGLLSTLEALLDMPMDEVLKELPISDEIKQGIIDLKGEHGQILKLVLAYENNDNAVLAKVSGGMTVLREIYLEATAWADELQKELIA